MSEHTTIVSATYKILGETEEYTGTFSITVNENTTAREVQEKIGVGLSELEGTLTDFGWGLLTHLSRMTAKAQNEESEEK